MRRLLGSLDNIYGARWKYGEIHRNEKMTSVSHEDSRECLLLVAHGFNNH